MNQISNLSNENLLGAFIPSTAAAQLIAEHSSIYNAIMNTTEIELLSIKNIGSGRMRRIQYLRELIFRMQDEQRRQITTIKSPQDVFDYLATCKIYSKSNFVS